MLKATSTSKQFLSSFLLRSYHLYPMCTIQKSKILSKHLKLMILDSLWKWHALSWWSSKGWEWLEEESCGDNKGRSCDGIQEDPVSCCFLHCSSCSNVHSFVVLIQNWLYFSCTIVIFVINWCVINTVVYHNGSGCGTSSHHTIQWNERTAISIVIKLCGTALAMGQLNHYTLHKNTPHITICWQLTE